MGELVIRSWELKGQGENVDLNISKDGGSEDFKAGWVCSIITENRSRDSEPKRGIFLKRKYVILNYFHLSCHEGRQTEKTAEAFRLRNVS